ncbi:MAG: FG-GAP repeat protein [Chitinophagales bacterium]
MQTIKQITSILYFLWVLFSGLHFDAAASTYPVTSNDCTDPVTILPPDFQQIQKILASDAGEEDEFGISVSISGNHAIVGALGEDEGGDDAGAAYIFAKDEDGSNR